MTVVDRKTVVDYLVDELGRSERRACALTSQPRSTQRYDSKRRDDPRLQEQLVSLASERRRFGYPRLHMMLRREGFAVGLRRIHWLYGTLGLKLQSKRRRHGARAPRGRLSAATAANERWSMDFVSDRLCDGRTIRVLTIVDEFSRSARRSSSTRRSRACASSGRSIVRSSSTARPS